MQQSDISQEEFQVILTKLVHEFNSSGVIERMIPRTLDQSNLSVLTTDLNYCPVNKDTNGLTKVLSEPMFDLLDRGGKRWRPALCFFVAEAFGHNVNELYEIAAFCEIVHNATLIIDDIEDDSLIRRDKKCVHLIYGIDIAINAGMFMCYAPFQYLLQSPNYTDKQKLRFSQIYAQEMTVIHLGQGWDIAWHNMKKLGLPIPTEEQYLQMTAHKTGVLARLSAKLTCEVIGIKEDLSEAIYRFAEKIGVAFQIQDDILNLVGTEFVKTKGQHGEDIHEGKLSLIVIHSLTQGEPADTARLLEILQSKTTDQKLIDEAISLTQKTKSIDYARSVSEKLILEAWKDIHAVIPEGEGKKKLKCLSEYVIGRKI